jgi:hypothetical protein
MIQRTVGRANGAYAEMTRATRRSDCASMCPCPDRTGARIIRMSAPKRTATMQYQDILYGAAARQAQLPWGASLDVASSIAPPASFDPAT